MEVDFARIQELIQQPQESLAVELKAWIDPDQPDGIAKIVKTALAMRNYGGGYMIIGFDNNTLEPIFNDAPCNVREIFHIDKIQGMITKYSSEQFEVAVEFPRRDEQDFPVIIIPTGVKTPVAAKSDFSCNEKFLIRADTVYVRSLSSNNVPSTTQAKPKDWDRLMEVCFDNREADIGRFIRRHLSGISLEQLNNLTAVLIENSKPKISTEDLLTEYLQESESRYQQALEDRKVTLPEHGAWEVGLILIGEVPHHSTNQEFLNLLNSSNPDYTGWPIWRDSRHIGEKDRPYVINGVWEALLSYGLRDFTRLDPRGKFFVRRLLEDDVKVSDSSPQKLTALDFGLTIIRVAEAIAVGLAFAKAMGCLIEKTSLAFAFKWTRLKGRKLSAWANPRRWIPQHYFAYQDEVTTFVNLPLDTPLSSLPQYVNQAVQPLFEVFDGFTLNENVVEDMTRRLIERRL
ncbi:ATP-binding protein [Oscillatoria sp. FACHB-1407]|uniref:AlbA family DNA-binding domain-containing protein n=1 Tax=Oscillatoria sp. FACHB-1407 TaxID=2692847 RepID=UPI0016832C15|nr:ATP-binding protein [Oscillatoria sp. FACHB-1407]MBD2459430.1 ATP-binding protein [Oscillatoria sp. FACHB-1407]